MKKIITLISIVLISTGSLWAQATPNAGFENWTFHSNFFGDYDTPDNWDNANPQTELIGIFSVEKATGGDVHTGSAAVKLITKNIFGNDVPGVVTTGTLPSSAGDPITGGIPYTLRPDSIVGWFKCTPQNGDNGFAEITLFGSAPNNADTIAEARFNTPTTTVGTYIRFSAPLVYYSTNAVANSMWLLGSSNSDVSLQVGSTAYFDDIELIINPVLVAGVSAAVTTGTNPLCAGESVTFTATPTNGGSAPSYQWQVDGGNVGTNSPTYTTTTLTDGQIVTCIMTSNLPGVTGSPATSNSVTMTVNPTVASVIITITSGGNPTCNGQSVTYTATPTVGGSTPAYQWLLNGANVGTNSTYTNASIVDGDTISCVLTSNDPCANPTTATSNEIIMSVTSTVTPVVTVTVTSGTNPSCIGENVTFTAAPTNGGSTPSYQWQVDAGNVGTDSSDFTSSSLTTGQVVTCIMTSSSGCASPDSATSAGITITVNAIPATPTISENGTVLTSSATSGNQWYLDGSPISNATGQTYTATQDGAYTVVVTENGCASAASAPVNITLTGIDEVSDETFFTIYPNPSAGAFNVSFIVSFNTTYKLEFRNVLGQLIYQEIVTDFSGQYSKQMNLGDNGPGMYVISLTGLDNQTKISRLFILK